MYTYGAISTGEFYRRIKKLNAHLQICSFGDNAKLAGLFIRDYSGEDYFDICGVDKHVVPEYSEWDSAGHIVKSGWRRVYLMLAQLGLTTPAKIQRICPGFYLHKSQAYVDADRQVTIEGDAIAAKMKAFADDAPIRSWCDPDTGKVETGTALTVDQNLELAADIRAKDPDWKKAQDEKDRWFLQEWESRGGLNSQKPKL